MVIIAINEFYLDRQRILDHLRIEFSDQAIRTNNWFSRLGGKLDLAVEFALIDLPPDPAAIPQLAALEPVAPGVLGWPAPQDSSANLHGNLIVSSELRGDATLALQTSLAARLLEYLAPIYANDAAFQQSYLIAPDRPFAGCFPYQPLHELGPPTADGGFAWARHDRLQTLLGAKFEQMEPRWLGPSALETSRQPVVSYVNFIVLDGALLGTLESEVDLAYLNELLGSQLLPACRAVVVDPEGKVAAASANLGLPTDQLASLNSILPEDQAQLLLERLQPAVEEAAFRIKHYHVQSFRLKSTPWTLVALVPDSALYASLQPQLVNYTIQLSILLCALLLLFFLIRVRYVKPFAEAEIELAASHAILEQRVAERTQELECMNEEITATNEELASTNEELIASNEEISETSEELTAANAELADAYEQLAESNERFRVAFHSSPDSITISRVDTGVFLEVNEGFLQMAGCSAEEAIGSSSVDLKVWTAADRARLMELLQTQGSVRNEEFLFRRKSGQLINGLLSAEFIQLGGQQCLVSNVRDVTELRRSELHLARFLSLTSGLIMIADFQGTIVQATRAWESVTGCPLSEFIGTHFMDYVHPEDREATRDVTSFLTAGNEIKHFRNRYIHRDGTAHSIEWSAVASMEEGLVFASAHDSTELMRAMEALRASGEQFRAYFELGLTPMAFIDIDGRWLQVNDQLARLTGYLQDELREMSVLDLLPGNPGRAVQRQLDLLADGAQDSFSLELELQPRSGSPRIVVFSARARRDNRGRVSYLLAQLHDITAAKRTETDLKRLTTAIHQATELITIASPDNHVLYANPAFLRSTGLREEDVLGRLWPEVDRVFLPPELVLEIDTATRSGRTWQGEILLSNAAGEQVITLATVTPVIDEQGNLASTVAIGHDMTQQRRWEQHLRQSQKLEAIGTLAGGIAHDFNNILFAMLGNTEMALEHIPGNNHAVYCLEEVQKAGRRARDLIRQILSFARRSESQPVKVQISDIVDEVAKLMRSSLPSTIEIQVQLNAPDLIVSADPTQIHQVLMNLCTNAGQAMEQSGGVLTFQLDRYERRSDVQPDLALAPGSYMLLKVSDTGPGIPPDVLPRIFEPFFTTKEHGQGTGMGLSVVHGVITDLNGVITVDSTLGAGAVFSVYLPLVDGFAAEAEADQASLPRGCEQVLLVDDEQPIIAMLKEVLTSLGYHSVCFSDSQEASAAFQENPHKFDLLFTDQTMPKITGVELALRCRKLRPELPVIICTGYNPEDLEQQLPADSTTTFLTKPLNRASLAQAIRNVLDHALALQSQNGSPAS